MVVLRISAAELRVQAGFRDARTPSRGLLWAETAAVRRGMSRTTALADLSRACECDCDSEMSVLE